MADEPLLILASASPRRKELLGRIGLGLEVVPSRVYERFRRGESPEEHALRLARTKALEVAARRSGCWVLGADTVVAAGGKILGKPSGRRSAADMLRLLSDREHRVTTGFCILHSSRTERREKAVTTVVRFKALSEAEIKWYIDTGEPLDKAGGYAIQEKGAFMIREIHGSYSNVVGLPLCEVVEALQEVGAADLFRSHGAASPQPSE